MKNAIDEMEEKCRTLCLITVNEAVKLAKREALRKQAEDIKGWMKFFGIELTEGQERDYKQRFLK